MYAILEDGVGLPGKREDTGAIPDKDDQFDEENDDDELIDVIEEDSEAESLEEGIGGDPLEVLRGELEKLRLPEDGVVPDPPKSLSSSRASRTSRPKTVVEYVRRGTRVVGEEVTAPFLVDLMNSLSALDFNSQDYIPLQLRSEDDRLGVLFHALGSDTLSVKSLPPEQLMIALALRWVIRLFSDRARNSGGIKDREKERWTKSEARAFLASFPWITSPYQPKNDTHVSAEDVPSIVDRNVQLMAQVLMALDSIADLSQILLLSERVPDQGRLLSGRRFHSFLTGMKMPTAADIPDGLWDACVEGLEDAFGEERRKKAKRGARVKTVPTANPVSTQKGFSHTGISSGGLFDLLGDMEV